MDKITMFYKHIYQLNKFRVLSIIINTILRSIILTMPPLITKYMIDNVLPSNDQFLLTILSICMVIIPIVTGFMIWLDIYTSKFILDLSADFRSRLFNGIQNRPLSWFSSFSFGDILNRSNNETNRITGYVYNDIFWFVWCVISLATGIVVMLSMDIVLTLVVSMLILINIGVSSLFGKKFEEKSKLHSLKTSSLFEKLRGILSNSYFIKVTGNEQWEINKFNDKLQEIVKVTKQSMVINFSYKLTSALLSVLTIASLYLIGGLQVMNNNITVGSLVAIIAIYNWIQPSANSCFDMIINYKTIIPTYDRIKEIFYPVEMNNTDQLSISKKDSIELTFNDVSFSYTNSTNVLRNVSFQVEKNSFTALIGPKGSGKSTISDLILHLVEPTSGEILINDKKLWSYGADWYRKNIIAVTQDVQLRKGTILDNLLIGNLYASKDEVIASLEFAGLKEWIDTLPEGINTTVGENGLMLSGGEKQRISIARALLREPKLLILDEATSALDNVTEKKILKYLRDLNNITIIYITHRTGVLDIADKIVVLEEGSIVQVGTHEYLLNRDGYYLNLVRR